jgi:uncharacterized membrane protein
VLLTDLAVLSLAACLAAAAGAAYQPIERFHLLVNVRAGALLLVIAGLAIHVRWLMRQRAMPMALLASQLGGALLGFELVTAETNDYFRQLAGTAAAQQLGTGAGLFLELMVLATIWTVFSLLISWYGLRNTSGLILASGLGIGALGIGTGGIAGIVFQPSNALPLVLSVRAAVLPFLIVALFLYLHLLRSGSRPAVWIDRSVTGIQTAVVLLGFELVTGETWDLFQNAIGSGASASVSSHLQNLEQLALSVVWLAYAGILMCSGIWRRMRWLRLGAIVLLGFVILKIFIYDLAFLQAAYRSVSFAGLGVVLLTVSYLYQRYRAIIWNTGSEDRGLAAPAPEAG